MMMNQQTFISSTKRMDVAAEPNNMGKSRTSKAMKIEAKARRGLSPASFTFTKATNKCHKQRSYLTSTK